MKIRVQVHAFVSHNPLHMLVFTQLKPYFNVCALFFSKFLHVKNWVYLHMEHAKKLSYRFFHYMKAVHNPWHTRYYSTTNRGFGNPKVRVWNPKFGSWPACCEILVYGNIVTSLNWKQLSADFSNHDAIKRRAVHYWIISSFLIQFLSTYLYEL